MGTRQLRRTIPVPALALAAALAMTPRAGAVETYEGCLDLVTGNPALAEAEAAEWARAGGGAAAGHCRALALMALGADLRAAELLVSIATDDRTIPDTVRATLLIDAGELFLGLGQIEAGRAVAARALQLAPDPRPALALSARLKAEAGDWRGAVGDLDRALAGGAPDAELLVMRASARLKLGELVAARSDLLWAAEIAPDSALVWLERGSLEAASGDRAAARAAWLKAIALDRDGPEAEAARLRIQTLEAGGS
jgi:tetratricopeptide (TPR) repeat protein